MKQDKELLLRDLSSRLPHGVFIKTPQGGGYLNEISLSIFGHELGVNIKATERTRFKLEECNPYLRPLSSMTEDELAEFKWLNGQCDTMPTYEYISINHYRIFDWLNRHHFDYRDLISKGLAIEVTKENNPYEEINL